MESPARVLIGERQPLVLESLRASLREVWPNLEILSCSTLDEVLEALDQWENRVDIVFFDMSMLETHDAVTVMRVLSVIRAVPMVVMSGQSGAETVKAALASGASGYLSRTREPELAGAAMLNGAAPQAGHVAPLESCPEEANRFASLSERQKHILGLILEGKLNKQIAGEVGIAEQTVKIHVSNILKKLGVRTRTQAAVAAQKYLKADGQL